MEKHVNDLTVGYIGIYMWGVGYFDMNHMGCMCIALILIKCVEKSYGVRIDRLRNLCD